MSANARSFAKSALVLLAIGFFALFAIIGMTIWLGTRSQAIFSDVIDARDLRAAAIDVRNSVQLAESSQRGFLITGNEIYLGPYNSAKNSAFRQLKIVQGKLLDSSLNKLALERMAQVITEKFGEMDSTISLKRSLQDDAALSAFRTNRGKSLMDEANIFFAGIIQRADERLTSGVAEQRENATYLRLVSLIAGLVIIFVVGGVVFTVVRYTRELAQARNDLEIVNSNLEERVGARTLSLQRANEEIKRFAYIVTHDLRAPLVNIMGFTSELERGSRAFANLIAARKSPANQADPAMHEAEDAIVDQTEAIGFIRSSTAKMDKLINAILKLSREGRRPLVAEEINLEELIRTATAAVQHQISKSDGSIMINDKLPLVRSDRFSLEQVFGNLLDNASKYRSEDRPLRISVDASLDNRDGVLVNVRDNGRGIAEQDLERIFELFRRAGKQDQPGEGFGLTQARTIIQNLGGDLTVTSTLDEGTVFQVFIPNSMSFDRRASP